MTKFLYKWIICFCIVIVLVGCFPERNLVDTLNEKLELIDVEDIRTRVGFFRGLWHGIISPVSFVISLLTDNVSLYEVYNNGGWYDFGFVLGSGILFGGGMFGSRHSSQKKKKESWSGYEVKEEETGASVESEGGRASVHFEYEPKKKKSSNSKEASSSEKPPKSDEEKPSSDQA